MAHERRDRHELANAAPTGAARGPHCLGSYSDDSGGLCTPDAVYEDMSRLPRTYGATSPRISSDSSAASKTSPSCRVGCRTRLPLAAMILHPNADRQCTRERIADWLWSEADGM